MDRLLIFTYLYRYVPRIPNIGETIHGTRFETEYGGKGANQAVAASRLGSKTMLIAKLGNDIWGEKYLKRLEKENIATNFIELVNNEKTGVAQINVDNKGDNQVIIVAGANNCLDLKDIRVAKNVLTKSKVLICQLEIPILTTIEALKHFRGTSILNAAPGISDIPQELLTLPTIFCVNETEASLITGFNVQSISDIREAIITLLAKGCSIVIITIGEKGAAFASIEDPNPAIVKTKKVDLVLDTTGAGDAFIGALAHFYAENPNIPLYKKIGAACEIASHSIQFSGAQKGFPHKSDLCLRINDDRDYEWRYID